MPTTPDENTCGSPDVDAEWRAFVKRNSPRARSFMLVLQRKAGCAPAVVEELTLEALEDAFLALWPGRIGTDNGPAVHSCCRRVAADWMRSSRREFRIRSAAHEIEAIRGDDSDVEDSDGSFLTHDYVISLLDLLPPKQKQAVNFRYLWGWPTAFVAEVLGCTEATVRVHTFKGLRGLRELAKEPPDADE